MREGEASRTAEYMTLFRALELTLPADPIHLGGRDELPHGGRRGRNTALVRERGCR
jgi:hypothetical protein